MKCSSCHAPIKPIVAIDIDGTLAQYHACFMRFLEQWLPTQWIGTRYWHWDGMGEFSDHLDMNKHVYQQAKLAFRAGGFKRWMAPFPGAREFMQEVNNMNVEVWITTTRPWMRMDNVDPDTREWLQRNKIDYDHLMFDEDKYGTLCQIVDANRIVMVLDDEAEQAQRCDELSLPLVLRRSAFNMDIKHRYASGDYSWILQQLHERIGMYHALQR